MKIKQVNCEAQMVNFHIIQKSKNQKIFNLIFSQSLWSKYRPYF